MNQSLQTEMVIRGLYTSVVNTTLGIIGFIDRNFINENFRFENNHLIGRMFLTKDMKWKQ